MPSARRTALAWRTPAVDRGLPVRGRHLGRHALRMRLGFVCVQILLWSDWAAARGHAPARRFSGRLQVLSGAALALPMDAQGERALAAYVPLDVELATQLGGPVSLLFGGIGLLAPFVRSACSTAPAPKPHALAAATGLRLDLNNSNAGSWLSPWLAVRAGLSAQAGVPSGSPCTEQTLVGLFLSPRLGLDLWFAQTAVTFSVGYDHLPRAGAVSLQVGLTFRLY